MHAHAVSHSAVADSRVNYVLLQTMLDFGEALLHVLDIVHTFGAAQSPDLIVDGVHIWTVEQSVVGTCEVWLSPAAAT